jgi:hypothetical protein
VALGETRKGLGRQSVSIGVHLLRSGATDQNESFGRKQRKEGLLQLYGSLPA